MSHKDKRLFNYVVNTLGISKAMIMEYVNERLEGIIATYVYDKLNSKDSEKLILNRVTQIVREGFESNRYWYSNTKFDDYVKQVMVGILEKKVNDEYDIETKLVRKDKQVIAKR